MAAKEVTTGTAGAAGAGGIISQWDTLGSMEWIGQLTPFLILVTYLSLLVVGYFILDLRRRVKVIEGK